MDFGLATMSETSEDKLLAAPNTQLDQLRGAGTRHRRQENDDRSDIYFAGCVFYHMLTGVAPLLETRDRMVRMN